MQTSLSRRGAAVIVALLALSACGSDEIARDDTTMTPPSDAQPPPSTGGAPEMTGPSTTEPDDAPPPSEPTTTAPATSAPTTEPSEPAPDPTTTTDSAPSATTTTVATSEAEPSPTTVPPTSPPTDRADLDPLVVAAMAELAATQGRPVDEIEPVRFERVTWRNGALGCPQPGRDYTQALVDGYRIVLLLDGSPYHFHGAAGGPPIPCANPEDPAPGGGGTET